MIKQPKPAKKARTGATELPEDALERMTGGNHPPIVFKKRVDKISP